MLRFYKTFDFRGEIYNLTYVLYKFRWRNAHNLMEVLPSSRALAIAGIEESFLNLRLGIACQHSDNVIDSTLGDILRKCHSSVAFERIADIGSVRKDLL